MHTEVEAAREDFPEERYECTKTAAPDWRPGAGTNHLAWPVASPFKQVDPRQEESGTIYKLMIGGIVRTFCSLGGGLWTSRGSDKQLIGTRYMFWLC